MIDLPRRCVVAQRWEHTLFAHWRYDSLALQRRLPSGLEIDTHEGSAWLSVVALRVSHVGLRWLPRMQLMPSFIEINLRTYVKFHGRPGVWFCRIEASSRPAVYIARKAFRAPFHIARMHMTSDREVVVRSPTRHEGFIRYRPTSQAVADVADGLADFVTQRASMYSTDSDGRLQRSEIAHPPWDLRTIAPEPTIDVNGMFDNSDLAAPEGSPRCHYAPATHTLIGLPTRL